MDGTSLLENMGFKIKKVDPLHKKEVEDWTGIKITESVLDPVHNELASDVWQKNGKIKPEHKHFILDKLSNWLEEMEIENEPKEVVIIGSITTFQYSPTSDIDVNVVIDIPDERRKDVLQLLPNETPLPGTHYPVNYYLSKDAGENIKRKNSAYDLVDDEWIKDPKREDTAFPYAYIIEIAKFFMDGIDLRISEYERDKIELDLLESYLQEQRVDIDQDDIRDAIAEKKMELKADLDAIYVAMKMVKSFRGKGFEEDYEPDYLINIESSNPDFSINNLVYKAIERFGYLEKLNKYKKIRKEQA